MKPTFIISLLLFSFIATCTTLAQHSTYHISGRVTDTEGEPLPGATISIKGKGTGAVTSVDGTYTLQLPGTGTYLITASYVGYQPQEKRLTVGKEKRLSFRLSDDQNTIRQQISPDGTYSQITERCSYHHSCNHSRRYKEGRCNQRRTIITIGTAGH